MSRLDELERVARAALVGIDSHAIEEFMAEWDYETALLAITAIRAAATCAETGSLAAVHYLRAALAPFLQEAKP